MSEQEKHAQLQRIGRLVRDTARALNADKGHLSWGANALAKYTAPGVSTGKTLYPSLAFGTLGAVGGGIQQARAAANEGDPYLADRALKGALFGGVLGGLAGTQYFRWGRRSAAMANQRMAEILKKYKYYNPSDIQVLQNVKGKLLPQVLGKSDVINPNVMYRGPFRKPVEGFSNIMRQSMKGAVTPAAKAKALAKQLHEQAIVRGYMGRGGLTQYVPNMFGGKLLYGTILGGAGLSAIQKPQEGDTRTKAVTRNLLTGAGGALTHNAGALLNLGAFMAPELLMGASKPAAGPQYPGI